MSDVLFISSDYKPKPGGVAEYIDNLARGLMQLGKKVQVLAVVETHENERIKFLENYEDWVSPFPIIYDKRPKNWLANKSVSVLEIIRCLSPAAMHVLDKSPFFRSSALAILQLKEVLRKENPKVIVFGYLDMRLYPLVLFLREKRLPYGIIAHDVEVYQSHGNINDLIRRGTMLKEASWIAANSRHTKELLEAWRIPSSKIKIVNPPISEQAIRQSGGGYLAADDKYYTLITIARLVKNKGIDTVLQALRILDERAIPYRYIIGGDGPERKYLEGLAEELGMKNRVHFLGYIKDEAKWSLLRSADLFVMPSRVSRNSHHEGFGLAFLEAAACGIPAVGSRAGGIPEAVLHGETGLLVPQESPKSLAEALMFFYENPDTRQAMGKAGMKRAISQFSPKAIADHFQKEILGRRDLD
jgi:glycosyltransferase involved in cell wall biosynthesis